MTTALPLKNKYCALAVLQNESDVEQFLVTPLLADLGYGPDYLATKKSIAVEAMDKGRKRRTYAPDYLATGYPSDRTIPGEAFLHGLSASGRSMLGGWPRLPGGLGGTAFGRELATSCR